MTTFTHQNSYTVPRWCRLPIPDHFDGMGGCWGVSFGRVGREGRDYCKCCPFYSHIADRIDPYVALGQVLRSARERRQSGELFTRFGNVEARP